MPDVLPKIIIFNIFSLFSFFSSLFSIVAITLNPLNYDAQFLISLVAITGYGLGGSLMALLGRVGGGIYNKVTDNNVFRKLLEYFQNLVF